MKWLGWISLIIIASIFVFRLTQDNPFVPPPESIIPPETFEKVESTYSPSTDQRPSHPLAKALGNPQTAPEREPAILLEMLDAWRRLEGRYPSAEDNPALVRILTASKGTRPPLLQPDHPRINAQGSLVDGWGTPFFFHHISSDFMEVRSAGPDRTLYTADDILAPPPRLR